MSAFADCKALSEEKEENRCTAEGVSPAGFQVGCTHLAVPRGRLPGASQHSGQQAWQPTLASAEFVREGVLGTSGGQIGRPAPCAPIPGPQLGRPHTSVCLSRDCLSGFCLMGCTWFCRL